jgi:hypothetical protein
MSLNGAAWIWLAGNVVLFICEGYLVWQMQNNVAPGINTGTSQGLQFSLQRHPDLYTARGQSYWRKSVLVELLLFIWGIGGAMLLGLVYGQS